MNADILVIDNNRKSIAYIAALAGFGYRVAEVHSPDEALEILSSNGLPSVIIVDLRLTDLDAVLPALRQETGAEVPIIAIVGEDVYADGADVVLQKPVEIDDLLDAVRARVLA